MYFENKQDMLTCVLTNYLDEVMSIIKESFKQSNGDVFEVFSDILKFTAAFGTAKENVAFCMNIFSNQTVQNDVLLQFNNCSMQNDYFHWFKPYVDTENFNLQNPTDLQDSIDILVAVTQKATVDIFLHIDEKDAILERYKNKITILKRGMLKENL